MELPEELVGIEDELETDDDPEPDILGDETDEEPDDGEDEPERERFVVVDVEGEEFALQVNAVQRLVDVTDETRVPRTSEAIEGITDLRGAITAVIDPRVLFDIGRADGAAVSGGPFDDEDAELVVFATGADEGHAGIKVDQVRGVEAVPVTHVVLDAEEVDTDADRVRELMDDDLIAGLLREREDDEFTYTRVVDAGAVMDAAAETTV